MGHRLLSYAVLNRYDKNVGEKLYWYLIKRTLGRNHKNTILYASITKVQHTERDHFIIILIMGFP